MENKHIRKFVFVLLMACHIHSNPLQPRDVTPDDHATPIPTLPPPVDHVVQDIVIHNYEGDELFPQPHLPSDKDATLSTATPADHQGQNIVIHGHKDEDIVQSLDGVTGGPVIHREIDAVYVKPIGEAFVVIPAPEAGVRDVEEDDVMDVAESGMVFRPLFRYRQESRSRLSRTVRRRHRRPRLTYYY